MTSRRASVVLVWLAVAFSFFAMVWAWFVGGMACDEVCSSSGDWTTQREASEWGYITALGVVLFGVSIALYWTTHTGRPAIGWLCAALWIAAAIPLAQLLSQANNGSRYLELTLLGAALVVGSAVYTEPGASKNRASHGTVR